jgi:serine protease Do
MKNTTALGKLRAVALASAAMLALPLTLDARAEAVPQSAPQTLPGGAVSYAPIVAANKPAVVTITTKGKVEQSQFNPRELERQFGGEEGPFGEFFKRFFESPEGPFGGPQGPGNRGPRFGERPRGAGLGSGFIIDGNGTIVTNNHVVADAGEINVVLDDGSEFPAKLLGRDPKTDLAVLKIEAGKDLPALAWGDSEAIRLGDPVLAIGNPFGIGTTVTSGIVSARGRDLRNGPYDDFLQVDAPINKGNSGGPLFAVDGKVVGVNTAIYSPNGGNVGVAFAIPAKQAQEIVARLLKDGTIERGYIGVQIQPVTQEVADAVGLSKAEGALVSEVNENTPAGKAGIRSGDIVTKFGGQPVDSPKSLARAVGDRAPGAKETIAVWRQGKEVVLDITVGNPDDQQAAATDGNDQPEKNTGEVTVPDLGIELADITAEMRESLGLAEGATGAIVKKVDSAEANERGIREGDIIVSVNQEPVETAKAAREIIAKAKADGRKSVLLLVQRKDDQSFVALPFAQG